MGIISSIIDAAAQGAINERNIKNNYRVMHLQQQYNENSAENANQRAINNYLMYSSPEAMVNQYEAAGLNAGLMYNKAGNGGVSTAAQGGGVSLPNMAMTAPHLEFSDTLGLEIEKLKKEIENISADTDLKGSSKTMQEWQTEQTKEQTENLKVEREKLNKDIENVIANTQNTEEQTNLIKLQQSAQEIENLILSFNQETQEYTWQQEMKKLESEIVLNSKKAKESEANAAVLRQQYEFLKETLTARIQQEMWNACAAYYNKNVTKAQAEKMQMEIEKLALECQNLAIEGKYTEKILREQLKSIALANGLSEKDINWYAVEHTFGLIKTGTDCLKNVGGAVGVIRLGAKLLK